MFASQRISCGSRYRCFLSRLGVVLCLILTTALQAEASNALRYLPEDALGFVLVRNLDNVDAKVGRLTQLFGLNFPAPLTFAKFATGLGEGIQQQGDLLVALIPGSKEAPEPQPMVLLPVNDYVRFAASIHGDASGEICRVAVAGESVLVAKFGEYALLMNVEHRETLELMLGLQQSPVASLEPLESWIDENDVVATLMPKGLEMLLELGKKTVAQRLEQLDGKRDDLQLSALLRQMKMRTEMLQWTMGFFESEIELVAVAVSLDEDTNLSISKRVLLKEGGKLISSTRQKIDVVSPLLDYADQPFVLAGGGPFPEHWADTLSLMSRTFMQRMPELNGLEELDDAHWKKLQESYLSFMKNLKSFSMMVLPGKEGEPLFGNIFGVMKSTNSAEHLESYRKAMETWNEIMENSTSDIALDYEISAKTIASKKAYEIVIDVASAARDPNVPSFNWLLEAMFGEDGKMHQLLVAANQQTLVYGMASEKQLMPLIKQVEEGESGLYDSAEVQVTLKLAPADAPWKLLISPQGCVTWVKRIVDEFLAHLVGQTPDIPDFDACPPVGLSLNLVDGRIEADLVCPVETLNALAAYIKKCQAL